ncbi:MAG TPA: hypothetical protein VGM37_04395 [Armatimonadota bacterium]
MFVLALFAAHTGLLLRDGAFMGPILISPAFFTALLLVPFAPVAFAESADWLRRHRRTGSVKDRCVHLSVMLVVFAYAFSPGLLVNDYLCDVSYRLRLGGWLQPWAESILAAPAKDVTSVPNGTRLRATLVPAARFAGPLQPDVGIYTPYSIDDPGNSLSGVNQRYVKVSYGGGFGHWGYILGPKSLKAWNFGQTHVRKVGSGVYRFGE